VSQSAMPVPCRALVPEVLPAVLSEVPAVPEFLPAPPPGELLLRLGAPQDRAGRARRPDATALGRVPATVDQVQYDDALCAWAAARARAQHTGPRKRLREDGKALRGAAPRGGRAPMPLSGIWDDGTTAAQLPVNTAKTNEITVFRVLLGKIPDTDLAGAVITADQMHTQREHARQIAATAASMSASSRPCHPPRSSPPCSRTSGRSFLSSATATGRTGHRWTPSPSSASPACRRAWPTPVTCWRTCAATGP